MEPDEYSKMAEVEDRMWWYRALHRNLQLVVERFRPRPGGRLLDAGCGTGGLLRKLGAGRSDTHLFGLDAWEPACVLTARRSGRPVVRGVLNRLPLMDGAVDCMVSADVLSHNGVDADLALRELRRCLNARGVLILNLPAYQWLLSYHDERVQQARRFTRGEVIRLLAASGFAPLYATYWNTFLFPLMVLRRLLPASPDQESDVHPYPQPVELLFGALLACESALLRVGIRLPFGGSVLVVARKRDD